MVNRTQIFQHNVKSSFSKFCYLLTTEDMDITLRRKGGIRLHIFAA